VKYEQADLDDILNSITQDFKPVRRVSTVFSRIPRQLIVKILDKLGARDLAALSAVNRYFKNAARKEKLWKDLLLRDFGTRDTGNDRSFRNAYQVEYKKRKNPRKNKDESAAPQGEERDKAKGPKGAKKEEKKEAPETEETTAQDE